MRWTRPKDYAVLYPLAGALHWLAVRRSGERALELVAGGVEKTASRNEFADASCASAIFARHPARWSILTPTDVRAALVNLPDLSEAELLKGIGWELEKKFRLGDADPVYDYEPLGTPSAQETSEQRSSLLVALRKSSVSPWQTWAAETHPQPERMEPAFSAAFRCLRHLHKSSSAPKGASVYLLQDGGAATIAIFRAGVPLLVRPLVRGAAPETRRPLDGEAGRKRVRESLLAVEDRYPRLELESLCALGSFPLGLAEKIANDCHLPLRPPPAPPRGAPEILVEQGSIFTLFGGVLGFA